MNDLSSSRVRRVYRESSAPGDPEIKMQALSAFLFPLGESFLWSNLTLSSVPVVCAKRSLLPQQSQHPDWEVPTQPSRREQHSGGELQ